MVQMTVAHTIRHMLSNKNQLGKILRLNFIFRIDNLIKQISNRGAVFILNEPRSECMVQGKRSVHCFCEIIWLAESWKGRAVKKIKVGF